MIAEELKSQGISRMTLKDAEIFQTLLNNLKFLMYTHTENTDETNDDILTLTTENLYKLWNSINSETDE
jgi:hypothetical protein